MRIAAYARYSSDQQREASIDDQLRNCRAYCARQGWPAPVIYSDSAVSGARTDRADYTRLLCDAHQFDVLIVDDLTRFGRDKDELGKIVKRLTFSGVRLIGVSDGVDTSRKSAKADVGLRGLMSELFLDDLAEKTHRGLTGRALAGSSAGGLAYGYVVTNTGGRAVDEFQAQIVRRIFAEYIEGRSPRQIAAGLNADRIPSARGSTWAMSAIRGDKRGIGILSNELYAGRQIWNRSRWVKHPDTGRRLRKERPQSEWIVTDHAELAIVDQSTWETAQRRLRERTAATAGRAPGAGPGRPARHLLSGLLRCETCGGPFVIIDAYRYGCSLHKDRGPGACANQFKISRSTIEAAMLASIQQDLLSDESLTVAMREIAEQLKQSTPNADSAKRALAEAERTHANIMAAIRAGILTPSTRTELIAAEAAVDVARRDLSARQAFQPAQILPRARERWQQMVATMADRRTNTAAKRDIICELLGDRLVLRNENGATFVEGAPYQINVVAGAGSALYLTEPVRIPIPKKSSRG